MISAIKTLFPGDAIATGTPAAVGPTQAADKVEARIQGIDSLDDPVIRL